MFLESKVPGSNFCTMRASTKEDGSDKISWFNRDSAISSFLKLRVFRLTTSRRVRMIHRLPARLSLFQCWAARIIIVDELPD